MKLLRRDTDVALKALVLIAQSQEKRQDTAVLARQMKVSRPFLRRVLQILQKAVSSAQPEAEEAGFGLARIRRW
ncbi:MAG: hypothetical protein ACUVR0_06925 [Candidatus Aminicenantales bacterium]